MTGLSMLFGNVYYAWQASRMSRKTGRPYTAQPYGVHTIAGFAYVYSIMVPVYLDQVGHSKPIAFP
jgi:AGZA family xanthine/uracil permease-like MFS transporter